MSDKKAKVSVVVPTWNYERRDELAACVAAIRAQTVAVAETIVVVDHNEELLSWARAEFPGAIVVANAHPRGVVGNRNTGIETASGEIVVLTDDDTESAPTWVENLAACFEDESVVGVTGELLPRWAAGEARWFPTEFYWVFGCSYTGLPTKLAPVRNPIGANMAVRREALEEIGGFRQGAAPRQLRHRGIVIAGGHALEDTELGIRIGRRWPEKKWLYQPDATVRHTVEPEQATFGYLLRRSFEEGASKAVLAATVGSEQGLESERNYLFATVPRGVLRGLGDALRGNPSGLGRAAAIVAGVGATGIGFVLGTLQTRLARPTAAPAA